MLTEGSFALNYFMGHDECLKELCYDPWAAAASRKITFVGYRKRGGKNRRGGVGRAGGSCRNVTGCILILILHHISCGSSVSGTWLGCALGSSEW